MYLRSMGITLLYAFLRYIIILLYYFHVPVSISIPFFIFYGIFISFVAATHYNVYSVLILMPRRCIPAFTVPVCIRPFGNAFPWTMRPFVNASLWRWVLWTISPLNDTSFWRCTPWRMCSSHNAFLTDVSRPCGPPGRAHPSFAHANLTWHMDGIRYVRPLASTLLT